MPRRAGWRVRKRKLAQMKTEYLENKPQSLKDKFPEFFKWTAEIEDFAKEAAASQSDCGITEEQALRVIKNFIDTSSKAILLGNVPIFVNDYIMIVEQTERPKKIAEDRERPQKIAENRIMRAQQRAASADAILAEFNALCPQATSAVCNRNVPLVTPGPQMPLVTPSPQMHFATPSPQMQFASTSPQVRLAAPSPQVHFVPLSPQSHFAAPSPQSHFAAPNPQVHFPAPSPQVHFPAPTPVPSISPKPFSQLAAPDPCTASIAPSPIVQPCASIAPLTMKEKWERIRMLNHPYWHRSKMDLLKCMQRLESEEESIEEPMDEYPEIPQTALTIPNGQTAILKKPNPTEVQQSPETLPEFVESNGAERLEPFEHMRDTFLATHPTQATAAIQQNRASVIVAAPMQESTMETFPSFAPLIPKVENT